VFRRKTEIAGVTEMRREASAWRLEVENDGSVTSMLYN
jgi:hypothetical protein